VASGDDAQEAIRSYLKAWHAEDADERYDDIEQRVQIATNGGCDAKKIYSALAVAVRLRRAHHRRLSTLESERAVARAQKRVLSALNDAVASLDSWVEMAGDDEHIQFADEDGHNPVECVRKLRDQFEHFPLPDVVNRRIRLARAGRPVLHKRPNDLLQRAGVPEQERMALLKALGFF
jgi:hypothetical protein